jgi:hypothetical protein
MALGLASRHMLRLFQWAQWAQRARSVLFALVPLIVLGGIAYAQDDQPPYYSIRRLVPGHSTPPRDDALQETIHQVRQSFLDQETEHLEECFAGKKVFISLRSKEAEAGYYTRSQLHFIFDKVFRDLQTHSFSYSPNDVTLSDDGRAFFRSEWTYKVLGSDTMVTEHLHFSFEKEKQDWRITELKSVSK